MQVVFEPKHSRLAHIFGMQVEVWSIGHLLTTTLGAKRPEHGTNLEVAKSRILLSY
jgi:hypothetical protein